MFLLHRKCDSAYQTVYGLYEEKRDECQRWEARVDVCESAIAEDLLTIDTLKSDNRRLLHDLEVLQYQLGVANETIEKQAIEIDALQRMLQQYQLGKVIIERRGKAKPKGVLK